MLVDQVVGMGLGLAGDVFHLNEGMLGIARGFVRRFPPLRSREQTQEGMLPSNCYRACACLKNQVA